MKFDYGPIKAISDSLIAEFGKSAVLVSTTTTGPDFDPVVTETTTDITLVELDFSLTNRNESLVQAGDKLFLVQAVAAPALDDKIRLDGVDYQMVQVQPLAPGPVTILYEVQGRA